MKRQQKLLEQHRYTGGYRIDYINVIPCIVFILYNTADYIIKDYSILKYVLYITPFALYPIFNIILKKTNTAYILYLLVGFLTILFDIYETGLSGFIYMFFAYNEVRTKSSWIIVSVLSFISFSLRFYLLNTKGSDVIVATILFVFIFATFYFKIIKDNSRLSKLPEEIKAILKLYCSGYTYEQISITLGLGVTPGTVRRKITAFMNKNDIKNDAQLGKWLHRNV